MFKTEICELFKIKYPIILGGMLWIGKADLVAAVSEAGGHNGRDEITTMALIPQIVNEVNIPVIAAGGNIKKLKHAGQVVEDIILEAKTVVQSLHRMV